MSDEKRLIGEVRLPGTRATPEETQRSLEMMTDLAARYQTERDAARSRKTALAMALRDAKTALERCGDPEFSAARVMVQEYARIHAQAAGVALSGGAVEDPRDALLQKCATALEPFARFLDVLESKSSRLPTAEAIHEIHYPAGDAEITRTMLRTARTLLAALRSAGVEPKP